MKNIFIKTALIGLVLLLSLSLVAMAGDSKFVLGGYMDVNYIYSFKEGTASYFDMYHFNPIFRYMVQDNILASAELEFEHGGNEIAVEYAKIDYIWNDYVTLTGGRFLVPFGAFNARIHPSRISKVPGRPYSNNGVVPTGWSENGFLVSGAVGFGENGGRVNYAAYITNGLYGGVGDGTSGTRGLRGADARKDDHTKAIGGRLGIVPVAGAEVGGSFYTCKYDDGGADLEIKFIGFDAEFHHEDYLEIRGEYTQIDQDTASAEAAKKVGYYGQIALKLSVFDEDILMPIEIAVRYSAQDFEGETADFTEISTCLNYYLSSTTIFRVAYTINGEKENEYDNNVLSIVLATGF